MSHHHSLRNVTEDRDLTRAAHERYLMLQALSERQPAARTSDSSRHPTRLLRYLRTAPRRLVTPMPNAAS